MPAECGARRQPGASWRKIDRTIPIIYGVRLGGVAAMRWKCSMNENAAPAFWNVPRFDHNEICGWGQHGDVTRQVFTLVERNSRSRARAARTARSRRGDDRGSGVPGAPGTAAGGGLAQLLDLMYVGD
jgi:glucose/mannose-6-phosphate isomerase